MTQVRERYQSGCQRQLMHARGNAPLYRARLAQNPAVTLLVDERLELLDVLEVLQFALKRTTFLGAVAVEHILECRDGSVGCLGTIVERPLIVARGDAVGDPVAIAKQLHALHESKDWLGGFEGVEFGDHDNPSYSNVLANFRAFNRKLNNMTT
jgi:hypothetical protein